MTFVISHKRKKLYH